MAFEPRAVGSDWSRIGLHVLGSVDLVCGGIGSTHGRPIRARADRSETDPTHGARCGAIGGGGADGATVAFNSLKAAGRVGLDAQAGVYG